MGSDSKRLASIRSCEFMQVQRPDRPDEKISMQYGFVLPAQDSVDRMMSLQKREDIARGDTKELPRSIYEVSPCLK